MYNRSAPSFAALDASPKHWNNVKSFSLPFTKAVCTGIKTSNIVFSPGSTRPRFLIASIASPKTLITESTVKDVFSSQALAARLKAAAYNGPAAPPTFSEKAVPIALKTFAGFPSSFILSISSKAASKPIAILLPWSPSPIALSNIFK